MEMCGEGMTAAASPIGGGRRSRGALVRRPRGAVFLRDRLGLVVRRIRPSSRVLGVRIPPQAIRRPDGRIVLRMGRALNSGIARRFILRLGARIVRRVVRRPGHLRSVCAHPIPSAMTNSLNIALPATRPDAKSAGFPGLLSSFWRWRQLRRLSGCRGF